MKSIVATIAALFAVTAMASQPAPTKGEEKKAAPTAPAASAPTKKDEKKVDGKLAAKKEEAKK
jgi:hypothetical protein